MGLVVDMVVPPAAPASLAPARRRADPLLWVLGALALLLALGVHGPIVAALGGIVMVTMPGAVIAPAVQPRDGTQQVVVVIAISVVFWMVVAHVLLTLQWWHPRMACALVTVALASLRYLFRPQARSTPTSLRAELWVPRHGVGLVAMVLWVLSLQQISLTAVTDWGLISVLPVTFFVGLALAVAVAVHAALDPTASGRQFAIGVAPVLLMIYATLAVKIDTLRYPWSYRHVGVIRLLDVTGRLHPRVDIYNNFSGFFGLGALVRGATGVDPTSYGAWAQLFGEAAVLVAVTALVKSATGSTRVARLSAVIYLITNWVGQNYFAPQTLGTLLSTAALGLIWQWFATGRSPQLLRGGPRPGRAVVSSRRATVAAIFLGLLMTHPLTPVALCGVLVAAAVFGWLRDRALLYSLLAVGAFWLLRISSYILDNLSTFGFGGSPTSNAGGNTDYSAASSAFIAVGRLTRMYSLSVWLLAVLGALACGWAMRRIGLMLIAGLVPFGIPLVQSYGGEAIYRVYLYSLPLMAAMIAWGIISRTPIDPRPTWPQPLPMAMLICLALTGGFLVAHFGRENLNRVDPSEVAMETFIDDNVPRGSIIAQFADGYPGRSTARYPALQVNDTYTPQVVALLGASATLPPPTALDQVADDLVQLTDGVPYIVVSPGMLATVRALRQLPVDTTDEAVAFLVANSRFVAAAHIGDTWLIEVRR